MQHWTLCEVLRIAQDSGVRALNYIDAHAMAPMGLVCTSPDERFTRVQTGLPGRQSLYELAWWEIVPMGVDWYPNSAHFVEHMWEGQFALLLCETEEYIAQWLGSWLSVVASEQQCTKAECCHDDWRSRFAQGLPSPMDVGLEGDALTLLSFDPYMISHSVSPSQYCPGYLYPGDLEAIGRLTAGLGGAVLMQLSTYTANGGNSQKVIAPLTDTVLSQYGFDRAAKVRTDGNMMSLIYTRNVSWADKLSTLGDDFGRWLASV